MGSYIPATGEERKAMLASLGLTSEEELFRVVPEKVRVHELNLPHGLSEMETARKVSALAEKNVRFQNGTQTGSAQKATYYSAKSLLVLEGNPVLHDGDNSIKGNVIRYYVNENRSVVEGSPRQRVHAVFSSNDKKGK